MPFIHVNEQGVTHINSEMSLFLYSFVSSLILVFDWQGNLAMLTLSIHYEPLNSN